MMNKILVCALTTAVTLASAPALAEGAAATAPVAPAYSTAETTIGALLDNPATKAVLEKHVPEMVNNAQIEMARGMTLKAIQAFAGDALSDAKLAEIDADLVKLPAK